MTYLYEVYIHNAIIQSISIIKKKLKELDHLLFT